MYDLVSSPIAVVRGRMSVPGDKSISHRAIILGSIAEGVTTVDSFLASNDCCATLSAFQAMGVKIEAPSLTTQMPPSSATFSHLTQPEVLNSRISGIPLTIYGVGKNGLKAPIKTIDCGNSGTTMRLLAGVLASQPFSTTLTGDDSLLKRPMERIASPLNAMGAGIQTTSGHGPLYIKGTPHLKAIDYVLPQASAQVKTTLLLAGLYAEGDTCIDEVHSTRDHTERMLRAFSYPFHQEKNHLKINNKGALQATSIRVPGDMSSAAFFIIAATITKGSVLIIRDVGVNPTRLGMIHILRQMGADITFKRQRLWGQEPVADIYIRYAPLTGVVIRGSWVPLAIDEFPAIFIAAACAEGETLLQEAEELRYKESDRIEAMVDGLCRLGISATSKPDGVSIKGGQLKGGVVDSYGDHRIAMAFAMAGAVAKAPIHIRRCASIATSFPQFISACQQAQLAVQPLDSIC